MSQHSDTLKICERNNGLRFKLVFFVVATATTILQLKSSSNNKDTVKNTAFWFCVWKKWCFEKGIAKEIENHEPT